MRSNRGWTFGLLTILCSSLAVYATQQRKVTVTTPKKAVAVAVAPAPEVVKVVKPAPILVEKKPTPIPVTAPPPKEAPVEEHHTNIRLAVMDMRQDMCLGAMIDGEASDEPVAGQYLAGYVGHMRAVDKWFGSDNVCIQVCKHKGRHREFDGAKKFCAKLEEAYRNGGHWPAVAEKYLH